jgi:hypothetical protein
MDYLKLSASLITLIVAVFGIIFNFKEKVTKDNREFEKLRPVGWAVLILVMLSGSFGFISTLRDQRKKQEDEIASANKQIAADRQRILDAEDARVRFETLLDKLIATYTQQTEVLGLAKLNSEAAERSAKLQAENLGRVEQVLGVQRTLVTQAQEISVQTKDAQQNIQRTLHPLRPLSVFYIITYRLADNAFTSYLAKIRRVLDELPERTEVTSIQGAEVDRRKGRYKEIVTIPSTSTLMPDYRDPVAKKVLTISNLTMEIRTTKEFQEGRPDSSLSLACYTAVPDSLTDLLGTFDITARRDLSHIPMSIMLTVDFDKGIIKQRVDTEALSFLGNGGVLFSILDVEDKWLVLNPFTYPVARENVISLRFSYRNGAYLSPYVPFGQVYSFSEDQLHKISAGQPLFNDRLPVFYKQITTNDLRLTSTRR